LERRASCHGAASGGTHVFEGATAQKAVGDDPRAARGQGNGGSPGRNFGDSSRKSAALEPNFFPGQVGRGAKVRRGRHQADLASSAPSLSGGEWPIPRRTFSENLGGRGRKRGSCTPPKPPSLSGKSQGRRILPVAPRPAGGCGMGRGGGNLVGALQGGKIFLGAGRVLGGAGSCRGPIFALPSFLGGIETEMNGGGDGMVTKKGAEAQHSGPHYRLFFSSGGKTRWWGAGVIIGSSPSGHSFFIAPAHGGAGDIFFY